MRPVSPNEFAASDISIGTVESPDDHQSDSPQSSFVAEDKERMLDDIKTVYHPHSGLASHVQRFQDYGTSQSHEDPSIPTEPWRPFRTRLEFEIAELALATYMNEDEVNTLCSLVHRAASGLEKFTVEGQKDLDALWELAADKRTKVFHSFLFFFILNGALVSEVACPSGLQGYEAGVSFLVSRPVGVGNGLGQGPYVSSPFPLGRRTAL